MDKSTAVILVCCAYFAIMILVGILVMARIPGSFKGGPPVVLYPEECWYCGCCVVECPVDGAISLRHPLMNQVHWVAKDNLG